MGPHLALRQVLHRALPQLTQRLPNRRQAGGARDQGVVEANYRYIVRHAYASLLQQLNTTQRDGVVGAEHGMGHGLSNVLPQPTLQRAAAGLRIELASNDVAGRRLQSGRSVSPQVTDQAPFRAQRTCPPPLVETCIRPPGPGNGCAYTSKRPDSFDW